MSVLALTAFLLMGVGGTVAGAATQLTGRSVEPLSSTVASYRHVCALPTVGHFQCLALLRTDVKQTSEKQVMAEGNSPLDAPSGYGYGPSDLQSAYDLASGAASSGIGQTVALVDAYNDPDIARDLATYRSAWGLPACGTGCLDILNEYGQTSPLPADAGSTGWDVEESLDVDMVSAICPNCRIDLIEANSSYLDDLGQGVDAAVAAGAEYVSNSYGGSESPDEVTLDTEYYDHPGVAVTASAGDNDFGVSYPAASPYVTSVGGTSLNPAANARGWSETVWNSFGEGTGGGCSAYELKPPWQTDTGCANRTDNDVSAVADPNTGVAAYDSYSQGGWFEVGGTSASSPIIAAVYALAGPPAAGTHPASYPYDDPSGLYDVTSGSNGTCSPAYLCNAEVGYDGPTGLGTPDGIAAFTAPAPPTATISLPQNDQTYTIGQSVATSFSCTEGADGPGLASCDDSSATTTTSGGAGTLDTTTVGGPFTYTVTASSSDGETATASIHYSVVSPVTVSIPPATVSTPSAAPVAGGPPATPLPAPTPHLGVATPVSRVTTTEIRAALRAVMPLKGEPAGIADLLRSAGDVVRFEAPSAGKLRIDWHGRSAKSGRQILIASLSAFVATGRGRQIIALTPAGRKLLQHTRRQRVAVKASFTPTGQPSISLTSVILLKR